MTMALKLATHHGAMVESGNRCFPPGSFDMRRGGDDGRCNMPHRRITDSVGCVPAANADDHNPGSTPAWGHGDMGLDTVAGTMLSEDGRCRANPWHCGAPKGLFRTRSVTPLE